MAHFCGDMTHMSSMSCKFGSPALVFSVASALAFPSRTETRVFVWVSWGRDRQVAHTKHQAPLKGVVTILQVLDRRQLKLTKHRIEDGDSFGVFSRHTGGVKLERRVWGSWGRDH